MTPAELAAIRERAEVRTFAGKLAINRDTVALLAEVERLTVTPGGWPHVSIEYQTRINTLQARLDKVRALHKAVPVYTTEAGDCEHGGDCEAVEISAGSYCPDSTDGLTCNECANLAEFADDLPAYPCPTIRATDGSDQ